MASQGTKRAVSEAEKPAPARKKAAKEPRIFDYSAWGQRLYNENDFARYLAGYPDKTGLMAYVYRLRPRINHDLIGIRETNIEEVPEVSNMNSGYIENRWGRGKYMLTLNDANRPKGQKEVCTTWFKLEDSLKPPVYDVRTLVLSHPDNIDEVNRLLSNGQLIREPSGAPRLRYEGDPPHVAGGNGPAAAAAPPPLIAGTDLQSMLIQGFVAMLQRSMQSPHDQMTDVLAVARQLSPQADLESVIDRVLEKRGVSARGGDDFDAWERMEARRNKLLGSVGGVVAGAVGAAAEASPGVHAWAPHVTSIIAQVRAFLPELVGALRQVRAVDTRTATNGAGAAHAQNQPQNGNGGGRVPTFEEQIEYVVRLGFEKMEEGMSGFDCAAWVCGFVPGGIDVYRFFENAGETAGVMALCAMRPETRSMVADPAKRQKLENFLNEFFSYDPEGVQGVQAPSSPAPGAAAR